MNEEINTLINTSVGTLKITKKLGKGKSGISYLAECNGKNVVYKKMHNDPCPYYSFSENKVKLELDAFEVLKKNNLRVPELLGFSIEENYLVKTYIDGLCGHEWIALGGGSENVIEQLFNFYYIARTNGFNIDYFPANFVICNGFSLSKPFRF